MNRSSRLRRRSLLVEWLFAVALFGVALLGVALLGSAGPAAAQEPTAPQPTPSPDTEPVPDAVAGTGAWCTGTGYLAGSGPERAELVQGLREESVHQLDGQSLDRLDEWVVPDGAQPVPVLDSTVPLSGVELSLALAGQTVPVDSQGFAEPVDRYAANLDLPLFGPVVRVMGLTVASGDCAVSVVLVADRPVWSSLAGGGGLAVAVLFGLLTVLVARGRRGGWVRRFLLALPWGLAAGLGQAVVLLESGWVSPFAVFPWWAPVGGVVLAGLLPLTRWRRRARKPADAGVTDPDATVWLPPVHAPLGGWQPTGGFARTDVAEVHQATDAAGQPALVKVATASRYGDPAARLRLEREAQTLTGLDHPNLVTLRQTVPADGPPTLVLAGFAGAAGVPLSRLPAGSLSGPQAVTVVLGVLAGLGVVHARGLVHRAVHPEHIWLGTDGQVVLANLELAGPGVEHPVAPEGADSPYASPQQRSGQVLDPRADLYACGAVLREQLTEPVPEPVAALLNRVLADDPAARPDTAQQLAAELRQAAYDGYGPDWVGRGALAGAATSLAAASATATGYALAGGAAGSSAGGAAAAGLGPAAGPEGAAGFGPAAGPEGAAGFGPAAGPEGAGGLGAASAASPAAPPAAAGAAGSAGAAGAGAGAGSAGAGVGAASGKGVALVNAAVAVVAGAAIGLASMLVTPEPAQAQSVVITPEQARVIFVRTVNEGLSNTYDHITIGGSRVNMSDLASSHSSVRDHELAEVEVGVPPGQDAYPAWFIGTALLPYDGGTVSMFARFDRESAQEPWLMTQFVWSADERLLSPVVDTDGWLADIPEILVPALTAQEIADMYRDWVLGQREAHFDGDLGRGEVVDHDTLQWIPHGDSYLVTSVRHQISFDGLAAPATVIRPQVSGTYYTSRVESVVTEGVDEEQGEEAEPPDLEDVELAPVVVDDVSQLPLAGEAALVTFVVSAEVTVSGLDDDQEEGPCSRVPSFRFEGQTYRIFATDYRILVQAWVPLVPVTEGPAEPPGETPTPTPTPGDPDDPDDEPAGPDVTVLLTDPIVQTDRPSDRAEPC